MKKATTENDFFSFFSVTLKNWKARRTRQPKSFLLSWDEYFDISEYSNYYLDQRRKGSMPGSSPEGTPISYLDFQLFDSKSLSTKPVKVE